MAALDFGVCRLTMVPVFEKPDYHSIQYNQLLFGESYEVTGEKAGWLSIISVFDGSGGWINALQHHSISKEYFDQINASDYKITTDVSATLLYNKNPLTIVMGSIVPISSSELFNVEEQLAFNGESKSVGQKRDGEFLKTVLSKFINAPYVPGGKTPFGSDALGFIQTAFKIAGHKLPRTADHINRYGEKVELDIEKAVLGDVLLLKPATHSVLQPAVLTGAGKILMMDGFVQSFKVDNKGIKVGAQKKYSWELVEIRRVI
jgi:hypothetical protein